MRNTSGQAIILLIMVMALLVFVVLWNYDLHKILFVKSISQNAGDSAALAGARWQGITLNLIGDLNIMHALALATGRDVQGPAIAAVQARLCFTGPMIGLMAAQQAAKNNGIYRNPGFDSLMKEHAYSVKHDYVSAVGSDGQMLFPEPYPGCWTEYGNMLDFIANDGVAAGPDNARLYTDYTGGHILLDIGFYDAISSRNWCWFYLNELHLLEDYENFLPCWWEPLPELIYVDYMNSEIFGLGLRRITTRLGRVIDYSDLSAAVAERESSGAISPFAMIVPATWYCYDQAAWSSWTAMSPTNENPLPMTGSVKPQYDYAGADAVVRVEAPASRVSPGHNGVVLTNTIVWTAAAKPFGFLNEHDKPNAYWLVLPAFHDVRLIPVDASSVPSGGSYNLQWRRHIRDHLPGYMSNGPQPSSCWFCQQLSTWENPAFRQSGITWLFSNSWQCVAGSAGSMAGGGTSTGH